MLRVAVNSNQRYTGFISKDIDGNITSFTRTRYPRKKYGVATIAECQQGMFELAHEFCTEMHKDQQVGFRVVLGLIEGYETDAAIHTLEEVKQALAEASVEAGDVFAIRLDGSIASVYTESVAVVQSSIELIDDVYQLGDSLKQERFTIEDLDKQLSYVVETRFCTEPD